MEIIFPPLRKIINERFIPLFFNTDRYLLLWGGRGSSKSDFTSKKLIYRCLNDRYFRYILVRNTYNTIKDSQYQTIKDIITGFGLEKEFHFRENPLEIICKKNGNKFYARGCDDVAKIKSIKDPSGAWYEEANEISKPDFITITTAIRTTKADYLQEILTFNPECDEPNAEDFWINDMFFKGQSDKSFSTQAEIKLPDGETLVTKYTSHHSTYKDNRWCSKEYIAFLEQLRDFDPYYYDVYTLGIWGTKQIVRPFANQYDPKKHNDVSVKRDNSRQLIMSVDFNIDPFGAILLHKWKDSVGDHVHVFDEATIKNASIFEMADLIITKYRNFIPSMYITGDYTGKKRQQGLADLASLYLQLERALAPYGYRQNQTVIKPNPTHKNSRNDCNYFLYHFPDFKINPVTCPNLCHDLRTVEVETDGSIKKTNRDILSQRADHLDCFREFVDNFMGESIDRHQKSGRW
jgi:PBSX family phage terminase large subunit